MNRFRILLVDDEARILNFLKTKLKVVGYDVTTASNGLEALELFRNQEVDLIVLDVLMPKMGGLDMLKELRTFSQVPVIILSARGADSDKIEGLSQGADDYLPKPFNPDELVARIEAVRRRTSPAEEHKVLQRLSLGDIIIDFSARTVHVRGEEKHLTKIEWQLLSELARNAGRLMFYEELLARLWGPEYRDDVQILRTWMSRLRRKLEDDPNNPRLIRTITKTGYILGTPLA